MRVCPLVFGTLPLGPLQANFSPAQGGALIRHALERGVDLLDTAELYETYPHIRAGLDGYRGEVRIATKTHASDAPTARSHVERALRELAVDRLDIVLLHGARLADPFVERGAVLDELLRLRDEGKILHVGLSSHYICAVRKAALHPDIDVVHPLINRKGMGILDGDASEMAGAIAALSRAGKGVYAMKALAGGNLISEALASLDYVRGLPGVDGVAVGMLSEAEIEANLALFADQEPDVALWEELSKRRRRLRIMDRFCKGCGACVPACTNDALVIEDGKARVLEEKCILCGYCAAACPEFIIRVV
ncbi:aldo/keto reductase [Desulfuromonas sp.]|nr:aldo/keto reductase [Desulfuromonas sp.]